MTLVRFIARPMLASLFIVQGLKTLRDPDSMVARAKPVTDRITPLLEKYAPQVTTETRTLVRINAGIHVVAGAMLATGTFSRVAAAALAGSMVPTTLAGHPFWEIEDPDEKRSQRLQFLKNVGMTGGLLLATVDTEGRPGIPWRARRAALDAQRMAKTYKREAKLTARATKAEVKGKARDLLPG